MRTAYARSVSGTRAVVREPFYKVEKTSVISAISIETELATMTLNDSFDGEAFFVFIKDFLKPHLGPGKVVVMDNVKFHYNKKSIELIRSTGAEILFLPSYSPHLNPIENFISKVKNHLKRNLTTSLNSLYQSLADAISTVSSSDLIGWFKLTGYMQT